MKIFSSILVIALGISMFVFGGYDDSPGAQLLGVIIVTVGVRGVMRSRKNITH